MRNVTEGVLIAISATLSVLCLILAAMILHEGGRIEDSTSQHLPTPPTSMVAWVAVSEQGNAVVLCYREEVPELRLAADDALAHALKLPPGQFTFLELLLLVSDEETSGLAVGAAPQVVFKRAGATELEVARSLVSIVGERRTHLPSGARLLLEQEGGGASDQAPGVVPPGSSHTLVLGAAAPLDLGQCEQVQARLGASELTLERREVAPGGLEDMIHTIRRGAMR